MKVIKNICVIILASVMTTAIAQNIKPIPINEIVPAFNIGAVLNSKTDAGSIVNYRGKLVIFDFWHTTCSACIKGFPRMMALQRKFGDKIKIFLVTRNSDAEVNKLFDRLNIKLSNLTVITRDTLLEKLFPFRELPNHIWIDPFGKFISSTFDYNTNVVNIEKILAKEMVSVSRKQDGIFDPYSPVLLQANGVIKNFIVNYSILMRGFGQYAPYGGVQIIVDSLDRPKSFKGIGLTPLQLLQCAYFGEVYGYNPGLNGIKTMNRTILETEHNNELSEPKVENLIDKWKKTNFWGYEVAVLPRDSMSLYKKMQSDLQDQLDISGSIEMRDCLHWSLSEGSDFKNLKSIGSRSTRITRDSIFYRNVRISRLAAKLNELPIFSNFPVVDETTIALNIDLDIPQNVLSDIISLQKYLGRKGIILVKKNGKIPTLIIKDKKSTAPS